MIWKSWFPWRFIIRRVARAHGFLDPIALLARLQGFAQPSEVAEPIELLRAGVVFHARGLINSRVIQHNLDWVWPYWVERQFNPHDDAFVPRAFSITHVNLTHRNWTAVGLPDCPELPIVDPRGLVTPLLDQWSLDGWIISDNGTVLLPSRSAEVGQRLLLDDGLAVQTRMGNADLRLVSRAHVEAGENGPECRLRLTASAEGGGWVVVALRPYNPEGVSFLHHVQLTDDRRTWTINNGQKVHFNVAVDNHHVSDYQAGDVYIHLEDRQDEAAGECALGMLTAAALFRLAKGQSRTITATIPLPTSDRPEPGPPLTWSASLSGHCRLEVPEKKTQALYDAAVRTLILHSPEDVYPGPYTYKRFWFRDAAFIIHALLCAGFIDRAERALDRFPPRQTALGFFHSQDGEWDSNGEALWIMQRFCEMTGRPPKNEWWKAIRHGAAWICRKRQTGEQDSLHAGLLPAGFSAEHLGPNDFYYWDDFWGEAGLRAAADLATRVGELKAAQEYAGEAEFFRADIEQSLARKAELLGRPGMPASPYRRLDAGAIGSLVGGYPLMLLPADDPRLLDTVEFLFANCLVDGAFFQDMIHSGLNAYLTLHIAQVLLRAGDSRYLDLMRRMADLASPTGQWPEAIHPRTLGGCMGDGQHVWAAAEWLIMVRNCFVREEGARLLLASGVPADWLTGGSTLFFGPAPTAFGRISVTIEPLPQKIIISWQAEWHGPAPPLEICLPGFPAITVGAAESSVTLERVDA